MQENFKKHCSMLPNMDIIPRRRRSQIKRRKRSFAQPITQEEALAFLKKVKCRFRDNPQVYDQFLKVFIDYKRNRIGVVGLLTRVQQLLDGHFDLIERLNAFLPKDYDQIIVPDGYKKIVEFLEKVEMRFADNRQHFLKIMEYIDEYKTVPKDSLQLVTNKIMYLLLDHVDLQFGFAAIRPQSCWFRERSRKRPGRP